MRHPSDASPWRKRSAALPEASEFLLLLELDKERDRVMRQERTRERAP